MTKLVLSHSDFHAICLYATVTPVSCYALNGN
jgi:hypothetical protein